MLDRALIGERIAMLRKKAGLSQSALAEKLGVSTQAVSKWETGGSLPELEVFRELAWLLDTSIDSLMEEDAGWLSKPSAAELPECVKTISASAEIRRFLRALSPYCSEPELCSVAKALSSGEMEVAVRASVSVKKENGDRMERRASIPIGMLESASMGETALYFAKSVGEILGSGDAGLRRAAGFMICPVCGKRLSYFTGEEEGQWFSCPGGHRFPVVDGVVDFGVREIPGELWSLTMKNYGYYLREQRNPGNPRYQMGEIPCSEVRWREIEKLRPRVILDIACGTCHGLKYDLQRIHWPCLVIMTDLSHRILKYNRRYFSEELVNPYVDIVYLACDCSQLPVADDSIDAVVSNGGFESLQAKMEEGFREGCRVLKPEGKAIYNMSILKDRSSADTQKWLRLLAKANEDHLPPLFDLSQWEQFSDRVGYAKVESRQIYSQLPAPKGNVFPYENEMLQWMALYLCVASKGIE